MLINEHTAISTSKVLLVPYTAQHVGQYHQWMQSPTLRAATASEPLTLAQEHAMQQSWRQDADKLTFIVCQPLPQDADHDYNPPPPLGPLLTPTTHDSPGQMIGDVNAFLSLPNPDSDSNTDSTAPVIHAELELMIARTPHRRTGLGRAALLTFLHYIFSHQEQIVATFLAGQAQTSTSALSPALLLLSSSSSSSSGKLELLAKIGQGNEASLGLFEGLGFARREGDRGNYFGEIEVRLDLGGEKGVEWVEGVMERFGVDGYRELRYGDV